MPQETSGRGWTRSVVMSAAVFCLCGALPGVADDTAIYTWRSVTGSEADARFLDLKYGLVYLETVDGEKFQIGLSRLIPEDRALAERLAETAAPDPSPKPSHPQKPLARLKRPDAHPAKPQQDLAKPESVSGRLRDQFGDSLETAAGTTVSVGTLSEAEKIGVYFAAQWDKSCAAFSTELVKTYKELKQAGSKFEVVLVSLDLSSAAMQSHMSTFGMPWYSVPFDGDRRRGLSKLYRVSTLPHLVIISGSGKVLSQNAVGDVTKLGAKAYGTW